MQQNSQIIDQKEVLSYDLVTIGSGSAARAAANEARRLGKTVAMIENGVAGGTCLNIGCVPSKFLIAAAATRLSAQRPRFQGLETSAGAVDLAQLVADKDLMIGGFRETFHVKGPAEAGIDVIRGTASFSSSDTTAVVRVIVTNQANDVINVHARHVLIASGASPFVPDIPGLAEIDYLTSTSAMSLARVPESLLVIGGNAIGLEQAQMFSRLGAKVTVVEMAPRIAPFEDTVISAVLKQALSEEGIEIYEDANLTGIANASNGIAASVTVRGEELKLLQIKSHIPK